MAADGGDGNGGYGSASSKVFLIKERRDVASRVSIYKGFRNVENPNFFCMCHVWAGPYRFGSIVSSNLHDEIRLL